MEKGVVPPPISIGTTGTIGSLMSRELESMKIVQKTAHREKKSTLTTPVSVFCGTTPKKVQSRKSSPTENGSGSSSSSSINDIQYYSNVERQSSRTSQKAPSSNLRKTEHHLPILNYESSAMDKHYSRKNIDKKVPGVGCYIVEVVDVKCGSMDKIWSSPITSVKKLGFSKLSDSV